MKATEHQGPRGHPQINALKSADSWSSAIDTIGLRVLSCDMTKAQQNNEAFTGAQDTGYEPLRPSSHKQPLTALEAFQILLRPQPAPQNQEVVGDISSPRRGRKYTSRMKSACHSTDASDQTIIVNLYGTICPSNGSVAPTVSNSTERRRPLSAGLDGRGSSQKSANDSSPSTSEQSLHPRVPLSSMASSVAIHREPPGLASASLRSTGTTCSTGNPPIDTALSPNDSVNSQSLSTQQGPPNLAHLRAELDNKRSHKQVLTIPLITTTMGQGKIQIIQA